MNFQLNLIKGQPLSMSHHREHLREDDFLIFFHMHDNSHTQATDHPSVTKL